MLNLFKEKYKVKAGSKEKELLDRAFVNTEMCRRGLDASVILYVIHWTGRTQQDAAQVGKRRRCVGRVLATTFEVCGTL